MQELCTIATLSRLQQLDLHIGSTTIMYTFPYAFPYLIPWVKLVAPGHMIGQVICHSHDVKQQCAPHVIHGGSSAPHTQLVTVTLGRKGPGFMLPS